VAEFGKGLDRRFHAMGFSAGFCATGFSAGFCATGFSPWRQLPHPDPPPRKRRGGGQNFPPFTK
jgi:hypothetical protein